MDASGLPDRLGFQRNTSARRSWRNVSGMNTSGIRDVEPKIKELNKLQVCTSDSFDPFNFFNIDTFDSWRSSPENSATYSSASLARALPLSERVAKRRFSSWARLSLAHS
jgi:hypothetical protein